MRLSRCVARAVAVSSRLTPRFVLSLVVLLLVPTHVVPAKMGEVVLSYIDGLQKIVSDIEAGDLKASSNAARASSANSLESRRCFSHESVPWPRGGQWICLQEARCESDLILAHWWVVREWVRVPFPGRVSQKARASEERQAPGLPPLAEG